MSTHRSNPKAFTLIELLVVLIIIAIVAAIAAPSLSGFGRGRRLDNAANQLLAVARWARAKSINDGVIYRLNLDVNGKAYWLTAQDDDGNFYSVNLEFGRTFSVAENINIATNIAPQADGLYMQFQPTGRCDPSTIQLTDADSGDMVALGTLSATEVFHVLNDEERLTLH
jgi:type II secretion system protein H